MIVYAHRGLHGAGRPENSMAAFRAAADRGFGIETDLRIDADGTIVLFHDRVVADRRIDQMTRAELIATVGYPVPTLADLLGADLGVPVNLEFKTGAALAAAEPYLADLPADVLVSSFDHAIPAATAARGIESALLFASAPLILPTAQPRLRTIVWDYNIMHADLLARAAAQGWRTVVYGVRTQGEHDELVAAGIDAIITDTPDRVAGPR